MADARIAVAGRRLAALWRRFLHALGPQRAWSSLGVASAIVVAVNANVLSTRFFTRWDATAERAYTLSVATVKTLTALTEPIDVVVLLDRADPLTSSVRHMLGSYRVHTRELDVRYLDPETHPVEFAALQSKYDLVAGRTEDGRVVTDASVIIARGDRHWFLTPDNLLGYDQEGRVQSKLEQALTEGIVNVMQSERAKACFTSGHRELSIDAGGPQSLAELRHRLERSNFDIERVHFAPGIGTDRDLSHCDVLVVAGPEVPLGSNVAERLRDYLGGGGNLLLLLGPIFDTDGRVIATGLETLTESAGIELDNAVVVETDPKRRLPQGLGEAFLAEPEPHAITRALADRPITERPSILVVSTQSMRRSAKSKAVSVLETSQHARRFDDLRVLAEPSRREAAASAPEDSGLSLGMAVETAKRNERDARGPRLVVIGTASVAWSKNFVDPALIPTSLLVENTLAWLGARPALVSVPERKPRQIGLNLSEESRAEVLRYVLFYMPGTAAILGLLVLMRRRKSERPRPRKEQRA
jgi:hypothetical protein